MTFSARILCLEKVKRTFYESIWKWKKSTGSTSFTFLRSRRMFCSPFRDIANWMYTWIKYFPLCSQIDAHTYEGRIDPRMYGHLSSYKGGTTWFMCSSSWVWVWDTLYLWLSVERNNRSCQRRRNVGEMEVHKCFYIDNLEMNCRSCCWQVGLSRFFIHMLLAVPHTNTQSARRSANANWLPFIDGCSRWILMSAWYASFS